jgi:hypothetical protein
MPLFQEWDHLHGFPLLFDLQIQTSLTQILCEVIENGGAARYLDGTKPTPSDAQRRSANLASPFPFNLSLREFNTSTTPRHPENVAECHTFVPSITGASYRTQRVLRLNTWNILCENWDSCPLAYKPWLSLFDVYTTLLGIQRHILCKKKDLESLYQTMQATWET